MTIGSLSLEIVTWGLAACEGQYKTSGGVGPGFQSVAAPGSWGQLQRGHALPLLLQLRRQSGGTWWSRKLSNALDPWMW